MIENRKIYDKNYYKVITKPAVEFATKMLPFITNFIRPRSVIDVGCGEGSWLYVWKKFGVDFIAGLDGDHVDKEQMVISEEDFYPVNLEERISTDRRFDLAMTLEVAEHLTENRAESFVEDLTNLSDVVMFSAAIPAQGGENHLNEQWQSYWAKKFLHYDYICIDCLRPKIWSDKSLSQHYRQNIFIYVKHSELYRYPELQKFYLEHHDVSILDVVHPQVWLDQLIKFKQIYDYLRNPKN